MDHAQAVQAYALYLNNLSKAKDHLDDESLRQYEEDLDKARTAMEVAWMEDM